MGVELSPPYTCMCVCVCVGGGGDRGSWGSGEGFVRVCVDEGGYPDSTPLTGSSIWFSILARPESGKSCQWLSTSKPAELKADRVSERIWTA